MRNSQQFFSILDPLRPTVSQLPSSSSSSAASDSAFAMEAPPYDDILPDRHLYAFTRLATNSTTTTTTTTTLPCGGVSPSGSNQTVSLSSSKSSLFSRASSLNSLGVIDESTPTPSQLASARQSATDRSDRADSPFINGDIHLNGPGPTLVRRGSSSNRKKVSPLKSKLPDYNEYVQEAARYQRNGFNRRPSHDAHLDEMHNTPRYPLFEKKHQEVIMM